MDFSISVRFRFGFEKNRGLSSVSVLKNRQFSFLCRSGVKYKKKRVSCLSHVCILVDGFLNAQLVSNACCKHGVD